MFSFLITRKMSPELRAQLTRSLAGRSRAQRLPATAIAGLRFVSLSVLVGGLVWFFSLRAQRAERLTQAKEELLNQLSRESAQLSAEDWRTVPRAEQWLRRLAGDYAGDLVAPALKSRAGQRRLTSALSVYFRADLTEVGSDLRHAASQSRKDAALFCFLDPPENKEEQTLLARFASSNKNAFKQSTNQVERLFAGIAGLPVLGAQSTDRVQRAERIEQLTSLRETLRRAPLAAAKRAAKAELLIWVLDEAKAPGVPVELDGAHRHAVRLGVVDLRAERQLLRVRKTVDPAWISEKRRHRYARRLVGCRLGLEARAGLSAE